MSGPWKLRVAPPARRALERLPEKAAIAVSDFILGSLVENPSRVGTPLRGDLAGLHVVRIGAYRVVYEIDAAAYTVDVLHIAHCADIYRPR